MTYLYIIRDAFNGRIVNYNYSLKFDTQLVLQTTRNSLQNNSINNLVIHSDHGSQFTCFEFKELLSEYNVKHSMSRSGKPQDNQKVEQLMAQIKREISPKRKKQLKTYEEMNIIISN